MSKSKVKFLTVSVALVIALGLALGLWSGSAQAASPYNKMAHDSMGAAHYRPPKLPGRIVRDNGPDCDLFSYVLTRGGYKRVYHPCHFGNQTVDYSPSYRALFDFRAAPPGGAAVEAPAGVTEEAAPAEEPAVEEAATEEAAPAEEPAVEEAATEEAAPAEEPAVEEAATEEAAPAEEPAVEEAAAEDAVPAEEVELPATVADAIVAAGDLTTLAAALETADLVDILKSEGPFTIFAPTDAAFAALPEGTWDDLTADAEGALTHVLLYHVLPKRITVAELADGLQEMTVLGSPVTFTTDGDALRVDGALIVAADIETGNGVIHVIDAVLAPPAQ